jgi:hypothetical protein
VGKDAGAGVRLTNNDRWFFIQLYRWFPVDPEGSHDHPSRDARAVASGRLSPLLALEIAPTGRATADSGHTVGLASHSIPVRVYGKLRSKTVAI